MGRLQIEYLNEDYGISSYIRGNANQLPVQSYYLLKEALETETPKVVLFSVSALQERAQTNETYNRMTLDGMRWSGLKAMAVRDSKLPDEYYIEYIFPLLRFHDRWKELNGDDLAAEALLKGFEGVLPVGLFVVHLVHRNDHGNAILLGIAAVDLGAHLNTLLGVHGEDTGLANLEGSEGAAAEVVGTGGVDDVDLGACELGVKRSGADGLLVGLLVIGVVGNRVLVFHGAATVDYLALEEHGFGEGGFTGMGCSDENHVADVFGCVFFHNYFGYYYLQSY